jgi:hypothetical protein
MAKSRIRELATPPGCHYSSLAIGDTATGITNGNKAWVTCRSENPVLGDLIGVEGGIDDPPQAAHPSSGRSPTAFAPRRLDRLRRSRLEPAGSSTPPSRVKQKGTLGSQTADKAPAI